MSRTFAGLLRELNVEIVENAKNHSRAARQTCAGKTLERIFEVRGYNHLRGVLISFCETKNNKHMLIEPVIWAVSDVLHIRPEWLGDLWFNALDEIELGKLYDRAKALRKVVEPRHGMAIMLIAEMERRDDQARRMAA
jgi:hypothetical protein